MSRSYLPAAVLMLAGCSTPTDHKKAEVPVTHIREFGKTPEGATVQLYTLRNRNGIEAGIMDYGGIVVTLKSPDRNGQFTDIVHGFDSLDGYLKGHPYFGAIVGRYGNRIGKAQFTLNGTRYTLAANNNGNALHGGLKGFDKVLWQVSEREPQRLVLSHRSKDGEEGYPGNLDVRVTYTLKDTDELQIDYAATTDKDTVVNLTNHTYFNLSGEGDILDHEISINASRFTPVDDKLIPTGDLKEVKGTPFDFSSPVAIGARINDSTDEQIRFGKGYDHNFALNGGGNGLVKAAEVYAPKSGRVLEVHTTEPGVQFYTGNFLDGTLTGKAGRVYSHRSGFCLETQHFPDSPNKPQFPSTVLKPGQTYKSTTVWKLSVRK